MASTYKVLGQVVPSAATLTTLYTVPGATSSVVSTLVISNAGVTTTYRVAIRVGGAAVDPKHYIVYDAAINTNDSIFLTLGISLAATDVVSVYAGTANLAFNLFGVEIT